MRGAFGVEMVPEPIMFAVRGLWLSRVHSCDNVVPIAFGGDNCFGGDSCSEAIAVLEARRWQTGGQRLRGGQWPPIQTTCCVEGAWRSPIYKVVGTTHKLRLVTFNCDRIVGKG